MAWNEGTRGGRWRTWGYRSGEGPSFEDPPERAGHGRWGTPGYRADETPRIGEDLRTETAHVLGASTDVPYSLVEPRRGTSWREVESREAGPFRGRGPKGYRRSDERVLEDVCEALTRDPEVDASRIVVEVKDGEVTLTGEVPDRRQKRRAEDVADAALGVKDVHNRLKIEAADRSATR